MTDSAVRTPIEFTIQPVTFAEAVQLVHLRLDVALAAETERCYGAEHPLTVARRGCVLARQLALFRLRLTAADAAQFATLPRSALPALSAQWAEALRRAGRLEAVAAGHAGAAEAERAEEVSGG